MTLTARKKQITKKHEFFPDLENSQKEHVCGGLLKSYLAARGYIVAEPRPDLGDDVWFATRNDEVIHRGQIKSVHTTRVSARENGLVRLGSTSRSYNISPQLTRLRTKASNFFYLFVLAEERFKGFIEKDSPESSDEEWLRIGN